MNARAWTRRLLEPEAESTEGRPIRGTPEAGTWFIGAAIGAIGGIIGSKMQADAAEEAAELQAEAARENVALAREMFQQQRADIGPYREAGYRGLNRLEYLLGTGGEGQPGDERDELMRRFGEEDFRADPGYQYRLEQGEQALNRAAAARGMFSSPATMRELQRHGQGLADQTYGDAFNRYRLEQGDRFNRLAALTGVGQTATQQLQTSGQNMFANTAGARQYGADAAAQGILNAAQANASGLTGATSGIANQIAYNQALNRQVPMTQAPAQAPSYYQGAPGPTPIRIFGGP